MRSAIAGNAAGPDFRYCLPTMLTANRHNLAGLTFEYVESVGRFMLQRSSVMNLGCKSAIVAMGVVFGGGTCFAQALQTHRIPAALALEAVGEAVASCAKSGYRETA